ncbi:UNVERIFIED_CONTAM: LINE-1 reverse transcriptase [Sesamum latifolium]|uniref:LINE-1 reverse transcriptase n=1 Tax=Sesamum latifolium TaxID=2727402 RepID=A0AAW2XIK6_9LAMI
MLNAAIWNVWGLNRRDHQLQLLPRWKWFIDYTVSGNRIWLAWDDDFVDVDVIDIGAQFIHCRVYMRYLHEHVLVMVVYGANDLISRRDLWLPLNRIMQGIDEEPWLVGAISMLSLTSVRVVADSNVREPHSSYIGSLPTCASGGLTHWTVGFLEISQQFLQWDRHNELLLHLEHCCRLVYLKATKLEQAASDATGQTFTDPEGVSAAFVSFYLQLLGGTRAKRALDLGTCAPGPLSADEVQALIRPFTKEEVKAALFDIEEDRAPGPDGYSSGFFKAAWPIVGDEVTRSILDFFVTGRLLKQVNAPLLTLIPKELFSGYNQMRLPPHCALKVDLRKAYDTVEWDFLLATLKLFGFPAVFIDWIEECITSAHFSMYLNGDIHGYFAGARGLRQGDPMSPYLFVLVMEVLQMIIQQFIDQDEGFTYHWKCGNMGLFQLCFADDLLLLCHADVPLVNVFRRGLEMFATLSGLIANPQKSHLIISKAAQANRDALFQVLEFEEGHLPIFFR